MTTSAKGRGRAGRNRPRVQHWRCIRCCMTWCRARRTDLTWPGRAAAVPAYLGVSRLQRHTAERHQRLLAPVRRPHAEQAASARMTRPCQCLLRGAITSTDRLATPSVRQHADAWPPGGRPGIGMQGNPLQTPPIPETASSQPENSVSRQPFTAVAGEKLNAAVPTKLPVFWRLNADQLQWVTPFTRVDSLKPFRGPGKRYSDLLDAEIVHD